MRGRVLTLRLPPRTERWWWVIVGLASTSALLIAFFVSNQLKESDVHPDFREGYYPGALSIRHGAGYLDQSGDFISAWPPGWSVFIAPWVADNIVESARRLRFVSIFLVAVLVVLVACLSRLMLPLESTLIVLGLAVFWPPMWALGDPISSEILFTVLMIAGVYLLARQYRSRVSSVLGAVALTVAAWSLLAAATLTKTIGIAVALAAFVAVALGFHDWRVSRRVGALALGVTVFALGLAPWIAVYRENTGQYGLSSNGLSSVRDGLRRYPHFPLGSELAKRSDGWQSYGDVWVDLRDLSTADPGGALRLLAIKAVQPWYSTWSRNHDRLLLMVQLPWLLLFLLSSGRTLWRWKRVPGDVILLHGCVAALWLAATLVAPLLRYLLPAFPFVVIGCVWHAIDAHVLSFGPDEGS
jgi:4-amino-4-deoxy-L-arabinose transferase-like glycosyltransferase